MNRSHKSGKNQLISDLEVSIVVEFFTLEQRY